MLHGERFGGSGAAWRGSGPQVLHGEDLGAQALQGEDLGVQVLQGEGLGVQVLPGEDLGAEVLLGGLWRGFGGSGALGGHRSSQ